jgi:hypothetical protein
MSFLFSFFSGGCEENERLPTILLCSPDCPPLSTCNDTNTCICKSSYVPEYDEGVLVDCLEANMTAEPKSQEEGPGKSIYFYFMDYGV